MVKAAPTVLQKTRLPAGLRLSLLCLWIYNDYFSRYLPGTIEDISAGKIGPFDAGNDRVMIGLSLMLAVPALMIFLSSALAPAVSRWLNVVLGLVYTAINAMTFVGAAPFYRIVVGLETFVTLAMIWTALRWPREAAI